MKYQATDMDSDTIRAAKMIANSIQSLADAITCPGNAFRTDDGKEVGCVTEGLIMIGSALRDTANAISDSAS